MAHMEASEPSRVMPFAITEKTMLSYAYYVSAHPGEIKVQFRTERDRSSRTIGFVLDKNIRVKEWDVVTVRMADVFRTKAGTGEVVKLPVADLDDLQIHAGLNGKSVEFYIDNFVISE